MSDTPQAEYVPPEIWTTEGLPPGRQFDAWRTAIGDAHMRWDIPRATPDRFPARICLHEVNGVRLTDCTSVGRVSGTRSAVHIAQDSEAYLNLVMVDKGSAILRLDGQDVHLAEGMFTLRGHRAPHVLRDRRGQRRFLPEIDSGARGATAAARTAGA